MKKEGGSVEDGAAGVMGRTESNIRGIEMEREAEEKERKRD